MILTLQVWDPMSVTSAFPGLLDVSTTDTILTLEWPMHSRVFSSIPDFYPAHTVTTKNISSYCQISPHFRTTIFRKAQRPCCISKAVLGLLSVGSSFSITSNYNPAPFLSFTAMYLLWHHPVHVSAKPKHRNSFASFTQRSSLSDLSGHKNQLTLLLNTKIQSSRWMSIAGPAC